MIDNRDLYEHLEQDYDGNYYYFMNQDVKSVYDAPNTQSIRALFEHYESIIEQTYYIIGNYLYFIFNDSKYYHSISNSDSESKYIGQIIADLMQLGCSNFYYNEGRLD